MNNQKENYVQSAVNTWEFFLRDVKEKLRKQMLRSCPEELQQDLNTHFNLACDRVREGLGTLEIEPEFVRAAYASYPDVDDPTGISTVVHLLMKTMDRNRVPDWRGTGFGLWTETPDIGWANSPIRSAEGAGRVQPWATAVDMPAVQQVKLQSFNRRTHELVIARPEAIGRYMAGAAESFRFTNPWREGGAMVVAIGSREFELTLTGLTSGDFTFIPNSPHECAQIIRFIQHLHTELLSRPQEGVYFLVENIGDDPDITQALINVMENKKVPVVISAGASLDWIRQTQRNNVAQAILARVWGSTATRLFGHASARELAGVPVDPSVAAVMTQELTPSMFVEALSPVRGAKNQFIKWWPLGRQIYE